MLLKNIWLDLGRFLLYWEKKKRRVFLPKCFLQSIKQQNRAVTLSLIQLSVWLQLPGAEGISGDRTLTRHLGGKGFPRVLGCGWQLWTAYVFSKQRGRGIESQRKEEKPWRPGEVL